MFLFTMLSDNVRLSVNGMCEIMFFVLINEYIYLAKDAVVLAYGLHDSFYTYKVHIFFFCFFLFACNQIWIPH